MTDTTHEIDAAVGVLWLDPQQLVIAANVRKNVALDPDFVASIREHGVLVPISAWWDDIASSYQVLDGQRRTLAAREAGTPTVPIWIVPAIAGEDQRITQQLTVNDRRKSLDDAEETAAVHDLALFGLTADTIRRRTSIPKHRVEQALAVAGNETVKQLLAEKPITLEHAAAIAEFADDPDETERLTTIASTAPTHLDYEIRRVREQRHQQDLIQAERTRLQEAGWTLLDEYPRSGYTRLVDLVHEDGTAIAEEEINPDTAVAYVQLMSTWVTPQGREIDDDGYSEDGDDVDDEEIETAHNEWAARPVYFTADPAAHGWKDRWAGRGGAARPEAPVSLEDKRAARERTRDWKAATETRIGFLRALVANKITTVRQPAALMLIALHAAKLLPRRDYNAATTTEEWLGTSKNDEMRDYRDHHRFGAYLTGNPTRAINLALTLALTDIEDALRQRKPQEDTTTEISRYLQTLTVLGHVLTPIEQRAAGIEPDPDSGELEQDDEPQADSQVVSQ